MEIHIVITDIFKHNSPVDNKILVLCIILFCDCVRNAFITVFHSTSVNTWFIRLFVVCLMVFNPVIFNNISLIYVEDSFIGGGNQRTRRKPLTGRKSLTNFIT
jgi:hypothetical protein